MIAIAVGGHEPEAAHLDADFVVVKPDNGISPRAVPFFEKLGPDRVREVRALRLGHAEIAHHLEVERAEVLGELRIGDFGPVESEPAQRHHLAGTGAVAAGIAADGIGTRRDRHHRRLRGRGPRRRHGIHPEDRRRTGVEPLLRRAAGGKEPDEKQRNDAGQGRDATAPTPPGSHVGHVANLADQPIGQRVPGTRTTLATPVGP